MADVVLDQVVKVYPGDVVAVKGIDLEIGDGELVVLVGPSGCGKSTTLRMIAGLEDITEGELRIGGRRVNEVHPRDRDIAMVFQSYALYPHMTVGENMSFGLRLRKLPKAEIESRVNGAAQLLGLEDLLGRKPKALSGGQRQRVAMGRAIVRQPSVFLFDEPLSNLDAKLRVQMRVEIAALHRRLGTTMVYVTHDQVEAMTLADRIAIMSVGDLQQCGSPMDVYHRPANRFVAGFIGSPAMNFVPGQLKGVDGELSFVGQSLQVALDKRQSAALADAGLDAGADVELGVRPQHLSLADDAQLTGAVTHIERMGSETFVHVQHADQQVVARLPGERLVSVDDTLGLVLDSSHLHLFGPDGTNLLQGCIPIGEDRNP